MVDGRREEDRAITDSHKRLMDSFQDDDTECGSQRKTGSVPGRKVIKRRRIEGAARLFNDYFAEDAVYASKFRRRFRMNRPLFNRILEGVTAHDDYFVQKRNAAGQLGCTPYQKVTAASLACLWYAS